MLAWNEASGRGSRGVQKTSCLCRVFWWERRAQEQTNKSCIGNIRRHFLLKMAVATIEIAARQDICTAAALNQALLLITVNFLGLLCRLHCNPGHN